MDRDEIKFAINWLSLGLGDPDANARLRDEMIAALGQLPFDERAEFIVHMFGWRKDAWDRQMKADTAAGKFKTMNREADGDAALNAGLTRTLADWEDEL